MFKNFLGIESLDMTSSYPFSTTNVQTLGMSSSNPTTSHTSYLFRPNHTKPTFRDSSTTSNRTLFEPNRHPVLRTPIYDHNWTTTTTGSTDSRRSTVLLCVSEGRGRAKGTIGLAAIDLYNPVLVLSQFSDNSNYECLRIKCNVYRPVELIVSNSSSMEGNHLLGTLRQHFPNTCIKTIDRKHFNEANGLELIRDLMCEDSSTLEIVLKAKYYCLSSSAALMKYIETYEHIIYANKSLKVVFEGSDNTMSIDPTTAKLLELIVNLNDPKSNESLFGVINKTKTRSGYRLLRLNLLQPSTDLTLIESRHDMIEEIISSQTLFTCLEQLLSQFQSIEIERIIANLVQTPKTVDSVNSVKLAERKIESIIILKHIISQIEPMIETLRLSESPVFEEYIELLSDNRFELIMTAISEIIIDSCKYTKGAQNMRLERCHAIQKGFNALLDIAREAYSESVDDIGYMIDAYERKYSLPIRSVYTTNRGYHLKIESKNMANNDFPNEFIRVVVNKNSITFTTQALINKNNRINASVEEIYLMSDAIITDLIANIRQFIGCLYNLSEVVSKIDLVFSFAYQCSVANYVRPHFSGHLAIKQGRHPILEKVLNRHPVPNNIFMSEDNNFIIITGPNMSGKSTFLKQVAILQVMAQIGSYIPAEFASFRVCDKLFSRIGNNDEIETNSSTFTLEMKEISYILHNITENSLVIIDELGRGTSVEEGVGLCFALCEQLLKTKAFTIFATHFIELTQMDNFYLNVSNYNFKVFHSNIEEPNTDSYTFTHILEEGVTKEVFYGLRLANLTAIDRSILGKAQLFAQALYEAQNKPIIMGQKNAIKRLKYNLSSMLSTLVCDGQIPDKQTLQALQLKYMDQIECCSELEEQDLKNDFSLV